jgi:hypothetical protein
MMKEDFRVPRLPIDFRSRLHAPWLSRFVVAARTIGTPRGHLLSIRVPSMLSSAIKLLSSEASHRAVATAAVEIGDRWDSLLTGFSLEYDR